MCWKYIDLPMVLDFWTAFIYIVGVLLSILALWAKVDAYRVIKDYAWFWGDFFFLIDQELVFNRVFRYTLSFLLLFSFSDFLFLFKFDNEHFY
jgi:hypothetical protein